MLETPVPPPRFGFYDYLGLPKFDHRGISDLHRPVRTSRNTFFLCLEIGCTQLFSMLILFQFYIVRHVQIKGTA